jgi:hypothetical protein
LSVIFVTPFRRQRGRQLCLAASGDDPFGLRNSGYTVVFIPRDTENYDYYNGIFRLSPSCPLP